MSVFRLFLVVLMPVFFYACKTEEVPPVEAKEVVVRQMDIPVNVNSPPYNIDIDSNGITDYRILVSEETNNSRTKAIFRIEGVINGILTTVIHSKLVELSEAQQCDVLYPSVLVAQILPSESIIGDNLDDDWFLVGDFHHYDLCYGASCNCQGLDSDVDYLPLTAGTSGFIGIRFIRRARKHFGWIEIERTTGSEPTYIIKRVAWRRTPYVALTIEDQ